MTTLHAMKSKGIQVLLTSLLLCGCIDVERHAKVSKARSEFSQYIAASNQYVLDYGSIPKFKDTSDFAEIIEGRDPKRIRYYAFRENGRDEFAQILDPFGQPILIEREPATIRFSSMGPDGVLGSSDDIEATYEKNDS